MRGLLLASHSAQVCDGCLLEKQFECQTRELKGLQNSYVQNVQSDQTNISIVFWKLIGDKKNIQTQCLLNFKVLKRFLKAKKQIQGLRLQTTSQREYVWNESFQSSFFAFQFSGFLLGFLIEFLLIRSIMSDITHIRIFI